MRVSDQDKTYGIPAIGGTGAAGYVKCNPFAERLDAIDSRNGIP